MEYEEVELHSELHTVYVLYQANQHMWFHSETEGSNSKTQCHLLTEALGLLMVFMKASAALVHERMVSVLPSLNHRFAPLSYMAVGQLYSLCVWVWVWMGGCGYVCVCVSVGIFVWYRHVCMVYSRCMCAAGVRV